MPDDMSPERKEQLRKAATLALLQRVKNETAIYDMLDRAEAVARSMDEDPEWRKVAEAVREAIDLLPGDAADFARVVLDVEPDDWDYFSSADYDSLVVEERLSRGLPPTEDGGARPIYESPTDILRRLRFGPATTMEEADETVGAAYLLLGPCRELDPDGHGDAYVVVKRVVRPSGASGWIRVRGKRGEIAICRDHEHATSPEAAACEHEGD